MAVSISVNRNHFKSDAVKLLNGAKGRRSAAQIPLEKEKTGVTQSAAALVSVQYLNARGDK